MATSLQDLCRWFVGTHLEEFPSRQLARVPYSLLYALMETLPVIAIWKLEAQGVTQGLDMDRVWGQVCDNRFDSSGLDFVLRQDDPHPPKRGPAFSRSIGCKEMLFQRLWSDLDKSRFDPAHMYRVLKLLFSAPAGPLKYNFFERGLDVLKSLPTSKGPSGDSKRYFERLLPNQIEPSIRDVLSLMVNYGWQPSHLASSSIVGYLNDSHGTTNRLLSQVQFVSTTSEQTQEEWFDILLSNPIPTLGLSIRYGDFSKIETSVEKCREKKKLEELIIHLNDPQLPIHRLSDLTDKLLLSRNLRLLEITSLYQQHFIEETGMSVLASSLVDFLKQPNFLCLRLHNIVTNSTAKFLILNFLSTPCLSEQSLELGGLIPDDSKIYQPLLSSTNEHHCFKSLILNSINMINHETLEMTNSKLKIEDVFTCDGGQGSLSSWLFGLHNMKVGKLLIKDYSTNIDHIIVPRSVSIGKLMIFVVLPSNHSHRSLWTNAFFTSILSHPLLHKCAWHIRLKTSPSHPFQCCEVIDDLCPILLKVVPQGELQKLSITVNENIEHLCKSNLALLMEAVGTLVQLDFDITSAGSSYWTFSDGSTYTHIRF